MVQESTELLQQIERADESQRVAVLRAHGDRALERLVEMAAAQTWLDARQALNVTQIVHDLAMSHGTATDQARARWARARALASGGRFEEAAATCRVGMADARRAGLVVLAGRLQLVLMQALGEMGRLDEAIREGHDARESFLFAYEPAMAARADINSGIAHLRRDEPDTALRCLDRAKPWFEHEPLILGHLENSRGEALLALNDFAGAEQAYRAALSAFQSGGATLVAAIAEGNLAELATRQGRLQRAMFHFERARRWLEKDAAPGQLARLLAEQADAMEVLGMPAEAIKEYEAALPELDRCGLALEAARARSGMGFALVRLQRLAAAETALAAAAKAFDELGHASARARVDLVRAHIAAANGRTVEARGMVLRALAAIHDRPVDSATARVLLAQLAMKENDFATAEADLAAAVNAADRLDLAPLLADALHTRGCLRAMENRHVEAAQDFAQAVASIERVRGALQADRFRAAFLGDRQRMYEDLVTARLDEETEDSIPKGFEAMELAKSRVLLDQMHRSIAEEQGAQARSSHSMDASLVRELEDRRARLSALYSRLAEDRNSAYGETAGSLVREIRNLESDLEGLERRIAATSGVGGLYSPTVELKQVQSLLSDDAALVEYFMADAELMAVVVRRDSAKVVRRLAKAGDLQSMLQRMQFQFSRAQRPGAHAGERGVRLVADARRELGALYDALVRPLRELMAACPHLVIVGHGLVHRVPFAALWDGRSHLVESHEIITAPSASLWMQLRSRAADAGTAREKNPRAWNQAAVVGVADEAGIAPAIEHEVRTVAKLLGCEASALAGPDATRVNLQRVSRDADLLHLAGHGRFVAGMPWASGLQLADGWFTLRDVMDLRVGARLVVLSGCETGMNLAQAGDELVGLVRAFLGAGTNVEAVLASLWPVDDQVTLEFMSSFYGWLRTVGSVESSAGQSGESCGVAGAVRQAQLAMMQRHAHPALWAAFSLAGGA